jgi:2'-deoxynucleoside 5'-phosphate N-hydrolase
MKVYFAFTVFGERTSIDVARKIVEKLQDMGHEVLTKHLIRDDAAQLDGLIQPEEVYHRDMKWLNECDILIADVSGSSFGVGYEVSYILHSAQKKAILFYNKRSKVSRLATGNTHPNCTIVPYESEEEVVNFLENNV